MNSAIQYWLNVKSRYALISTFNLLFFTIDNSLLIWITVISGVFFTYRLFRFIDLFGKEILIIDLIELLIILQWLFAPALYFTVYRYHLVDWQWFYDKMEVSPAQYFLLAFPCSILFLIGLRFGGNRYRAEASKILDFITAQNQKYFLIGIILCFTGYFSQYFRTYLSPSFNFIFTLFGSLFYIGIIYVLFSRSRFKWLFFGILISVMLYQAVYSGMFGSIIWWPLIIVMFASVRIRIWYIIKLIAVFAGFFLFTVLQQVKLRYRQLTWNRSIYAVELSKYEVLKSLINNQLVNLNLLDWNFYYPLLNRMNQGIHVSRVMKYVPDKKPFTNGKALAVSIGASLLPRFLWKDKPKAGGSEDYLRYTGIRVSRGTSMSIGQLGDAYINFALWGAPLLLLLYGRFINFLYSKILKYSLMEASLLLFSPLIFIDLINVEVDFLTVINYSVKASLFVAFVFILLYKNILKKNFNS